MHDNVHMTSLCAAALFVAGIMAASARADVTHWTAPLGGAFNDPDNWSDGAPGSQSTAVFDLRGDFEVFLDQASFANQLLINAGDVNVLAGGNVLSLTSALVWTPSLIIAGDTGSVASLNLIGGSMAGGFAIIGDDAGAYGALSLTGGAHLDLNGHTWIGFAGTGALNLHDGSSMYSVAATIGSTSGSLGEVAISGGSHWEVASNVRLGQFLGSQGHVTVKGDDSLWEIHGNLDIGLKDKGTLTISDGAAVHVHGAAYIGALAVPISDVVFERGEALVEGAASLLETPGDLWVGQQQTWPNFPGWTGRLTLRGGGRAVAGGALKQQMGEIHVHLASSGDYATAPAIAAASSTHPSGAVIDVFLVDDFIPKVGDMFRIITLPTAALALPPIPWPLEWQVVETGEEVQLHVTFTVDADLTGDGSVGVEDLLLLLANWGPCADPTPGECVGDLNFDGIVGIADLLLLLANWG